MTIRTLAPALFLLITASAIAQPTTQWSALANTTWYNGTDTEFSITTAEELAGLSSLVAAGNDFTGKAINIESDLDLGAHLWTPIGPDYNFPFSGTVNGNDHVISNLFVVLPEEDWVGLFGMVTNSSLSNIRIDGAYIRAFGTAGSLVGNASTNSSITDCHATGVDLVAGDFNVGGLAGSIMTNSTMLRCSSTGSVSGVSQVGGLVGSPWDLTSITECWSAGTVSGDYLIGGLAGFCTFAFGPNRDNTLNNCFSRANASATIGRAGGLYGGNQGALIISNCYSTGTATGTELVGGFIGAAGGLTVTNSYWDTESSGLSVGIQWDGPQTTQQITGLATAAMKTLSMVDSLNNGQAAGPWTINPAVNDGYPAFEGMTTGITAMAAQTTSVSVSPTLFDLTVQVQSEAALIAYSLYNGQGALVRNAGLSGTTATLEMSGLTPGAYLLKVNTEKGIATHRIVKQ